MEQGKPLAESKAEIMMAAEVTEWFAEEGRRVYGRVVPPRDFSVFQSVVKQPVGPVAAFTPWNFPINQVVRKLAAALATGCSIIVKAPEETPASPAGLIQAFIDAGVPADVINLIYGNPAQISEYLIPHPIIRKITFTGSTAVGKQLAAMAGLHMKRATMELGGHAPVIVAEDADVELAARSILGAKIRNAGQVCISPTRFLVHQDLEASFVKSLVAQINALKIGDGLQDGTTMGPLANTRRLTAVSQFVEDAVQKGAKVATGGQRIGEVGNFFAPTVLTDIAPGSRVFNEEPFGPLIAVKSFTNLDEAIVEANRLAYGLAGYAFTTSLKTAHRITQDLQVGMVWVNQPPMAWPEMHFGGINDSGYGSEGGIEGLEAYLNLKSISIKH
jgi:succinate-semialdehyde dehydrogenase/glutarate-semialdehyde dehydrogenase